MTTLRSLRLGPLLLCFGIALLMCAGVVLLAGQNPLVAGAALVRGAAGSQSRLAESLSKTIPLILTGLGVAIAFRGGFFNIGAEGQFLIGALAATGLATKLSMPVPVVMLGGALAGAGWAGVAGVLKTRRGAPEIITTIMLNYIAVQVVVFSLQLPESPGGMHGWLLEKSQSQPQSDVYPGAAQLPALIPGTTLHIGIFFALACAAACWWLLFRSERGFLLRAVGANPLASRAAGIVPEKYQLQAVLLSGALAGLGGALETAGATKQLGQVAPGYGYTAIAVALMGGLNPLAVVPTALLFGMLDAGGKTMERDAGVPAVTVQIVIGVVIFAVAVLPRLRRKA